MRSLFTKFRVPALVFVLSLALVPTTASAAMRDDGPSFEQRFVQVIKNVLRKLHVTSNSDQISVPKP
ncbi:MAG TPA: hypothetical protein VG963_10120 [Polyangiaceae bacterium]|nr:hypothetical protein [Polyangiaceae bacterium]